MRSSMRGGSGFRAAAKRGRRSHHTPGPGAGVGRHGGRGPSGGSYPDATGGAARYDCGPTLFRRPAVRKLLVVSLVAGALALGMFVPRGSSAPALAEKAGRFEYGELQYSDRFVVPA